jgi:hypothetical protein
MKSDYRDENLKITRLTNITCRTHDSTLCSRVSKNIQVLTQVGYSATGGIDVSQDNYFDIEAVQKQFERVFQRSTFKIEYTGHDIELVVDYARIDSTNESSLNNFGKRVSIRCPAKETMFLDAHDHMQSIFACDASKRQSKVLLGVDQRTEADGSRANPIGPTAKFVHHTFYLSAY